MNYNFCLDVMYITPHLHVVKRCFHFPPMNTDSTIEIIGTSYIDEEVSIFFVAMAL